MTRKNIILSAVIACILAVSLFACAAMNTAKTLVSGVLPGDKEVRNARPVPSFTVENFRDSAAVKFLVVGDWGTGVSFQRRVGEAMAARADSMRAAFIISTGDNIYNNGVSSIDDPQWKTKFEDIYNQKALELPWYVVLGNHDWRGSVQAQIEYTKKNPRWNMPAAYYKFTKVLDSVTSVDFFMVDTDPIHRDVKDYIAAQKTWLKGQLDSSTAHWKIVVGHHPIRSHGGYGDQPAQIQHLKPFLDSAGVDLYMNGHDHDLQYLKSPQDKFYCLISGAGGGARETAYGTNSIFAATNGGANFIAITRDRIYVEFFNINGKILFATSIRKETPSIKEIAAPQERDSK
jgi:acid phosphatase